MIGFEPGVRRLLFFLVLVLPLAAQQSIPDAPQPKNPQPQFPAGTAPAPKNDHPEAPAPAAEPTPPSPTPPSSTQPEGGIATSRNDLYTYGVRVNFVQVPVTVKDSSGQLVAGLTPQDFRIYENGVRQRLTFMTSDPFPLTAAVVIDTDLPSTTMKKVNETLPALIGAFSKFDEVALYRYGHTVQQVTNFSGADNISTASLHSIQRPGREGGPPMIGGGPFSHNGPMLNGHEADPSVQPQAVPAPVQESYVLNDAILRAANDLARRDKTRRKIIFVISDGRELGSTARYDEVRRVLLSHNIQVYALGVDTAAIPIYDRLNRIRFPGFGYGNILPRYASDTAGQTYAAFDRSSIEKAYSRITDVARNQYTLGYNARPTASSGYRSIEVRVLRPNLTVIAKQGYYPLPPGPLPQPAAQKR
ncbi:MAG TPA: VWA domain-containing protein [Candidatus Angelobacter sp.]|nr:VWA domain-containing protein [Candidatus Angelobacter sp.]